MAILNFDLEEVERLLLHSQAAKAWSEPYRPDEKGSPGLILVKDHGIYLMSNGKPELGRGSDYVAYARRFDPTVPKCDLGELWEAARAAVGGDDFAEHLPAELIQKAIDNGREAAVKLTLSRHRLPRGSESTASDEQTMRMAALEGKIATPRVRLKVTKTKIGAL